MWALDLLRLLVVQLRHYLMADESGDCFSNTLCCAAQVSRVLEFLSYVSKRGIASTSTSGRGQKEG